MSVRQGGNTIAGTGYTKSEIDTIASGKANVALDNITSAGKEICANLSMPSGTYTNLTLGASGTSYTAPADGYVTIAKACSGSGQEIELINKSNDITNKVVGYNGSSAGLVIPVSKGDTFRTNYTFSGTTWYFRFVYAQGSK